MSRQAISYVQGLPDTPLLGQTIGEALAEAARRWPDSDALVSRTEGVRWSWRELDARTTSLAAGLLGLGLVPGDRIGIWSPNNAAWTLTQFAAARAGLILVTINPAYRLTELEYALNKVGCAALVSASAFKSSDYVGMLDALAPELAAGGPGPLAAARLPFLRHVIQIGGKAAGRIGFDELASCPDQAALARLSDIAAQVQFDAAANIQFTSGTTGAPKGVTLSHHNILNNGYMVGRAIGLTPADRLCIPVPLYHCFGMVMGNLACVTSGAAMIYPAPVFEAEATLAAVSAEGCTALYGVPTMFIAELDHPRFADYRLDTLRTGIMAGSPCPIEVMRRVMERMNMRDLTIAYGMTETSPVSFQSRADTPLDLRVATVGQVHPHLEVKIVDGEGRVVPRGVAGELCTRGYSVMLGYWDEPARTAEAIDAGRWMHSGDLASLDDDGYCRIVGRIKDLVIRGGENLYPREIEEFLYRHPKIQDVQVFGVPDARYGEELCAWVRAREGETLTADEVRLFCAGQISHQKIPRHIVFVDEFPMTVTGKVQKYLMREEMVRRLDSAQEGSRRATAAMPQDGAGAA